MSRSRRKAVEGTSLRKYLQTPGEQETELMESSEPTLGEIKSWLEGKFHNIGSYGKSLKADFKIFNENLLRIEGNLTTLERTVDKVQAKTVNTRQAIAAVIDKVGNLEGMVKYL